MNAFYKSDTQFLLKDCVSGIWKIIILRNYRIKTLTSSLFPFIDFN
jgi:hypothetical protein